MARLLVLPALWSAMVAMSPVPIHPCGGMEHGVAAVAGAIDGEHAEHAEHAEHSEHASALHSEAGQQHDESSNCECVGCGTPAVAAAMPSVGFSAAVEKIVATPQSRPAAARVSVTPVPHSLPFANAPPQR